MWTRMTLVVYRARLLVMCCLCLDMLRSLGSCIISILLRGLIRVYRIYRSYRLFLSS